MASMQEEDVLGKAYDGRLMKRLLAYLRPYKWQVAIALTSIVLRAVADVFGPVLTAIAIDKYLAPRLVFQSPTAQTSPSFHVFLRLRAYADHHLSADALTGIGQIALIYASMIVFGFFLEFS